MKNEKLEKIKKEYEKYYTERIEKDTLLKKTELGLYGPSSGENVFELFKKIKLEKYNRFLDLGSGDGKIVLIASLFTKAAGVEVDEELFDVSNKMKKKAGIDDKRAEFINKDFYDIDISKYDLVFINPDRNFYELEKKLRKELRGKLIAYDNIYRPLNLALKQEFAVNGTWVGVYENV